VSAATSPVRVRRARTGDVPAIRALVAHYVTERILLAKDLVTLYEDVPDFRVAELDGVVIGCGAVHVLWEDIAEVRTLAVDPTRRGLGVGSALLADLLDTARALGVERVFCLTFEVDFFARHGFMESDGAVVGAEVFAEMVRSHDEGVAEFLDLDRVRPNTLGNTRMIRRLEMP
jgi:amino-acid N-acetyltransferase